MLTVTFLLTETETLRRFLSLPPLLSLSLRGLSYTVCHLPATVTSSSAAARQKCLVGECLPYVDTLVEVDLEGELYGAPFAKT